MVKGSQAIKQVRKERKIEERKEGRKVEKIEERKEGK